MSFDLTNKNISDSFQNLLQVTGSNNNLHDLTGNPIIDLTISGALYAQSYIVSQSTIVVTSGSTVFGNTADDTHIFIGTLSGSNTSGIGGLTIKGNISASGDYYAGDGIYLGGVKRSTWPSAGSVGDWLDNGLGAQTSSMDVIVDGFVSASSLEVNAVNGTDDFFLLKSGSLSVLKLNNEGVLQLGAFTFIPTAVSGGLYYDKTDDEFYLGKENN